MKQVVLMGSKDIGFECLKILHDYSTKLEYVIRGVLTNDRGNKIQQFAKKNGLRLVESLDEYLTLEKVDIAISVQYHEILKLRHLAKATQISVNLHMAPLPEYRGCNQFSHAIVDEAEEFGTTIHVMNEKIDGGDILFEERFLMPKDCWIGELYKITCEKSLKLFESSLPRIISNNVDPKKQSLYKNFRQSAIYYRKDIDSLKHIDMSWDCARIERHIRATSMLGHEPPYCLIGGKKVYFKVEG